MQQHLRCITFLYLGREKRGVVGVPSDVSLDDSRDFQLEVSRALNVKAGSPVRQEKNKLVPYSNLK